MPLWKRYRRLIQLTIRPPCSIPALKSITTSQNLRLQPSKHEHSTSTPALPAFRAAVIPIASLPRENSRTRDHARQVLEAKSMTCLPVTRLPHLSWTKRGESTVCHIQARWCERRDSMMCSGYALTPLHLKSRKVQHARVCFSIHQAMH